MLPVIGTKELIAWLPTLLGLGPDDVVVVPELAYPTYEVGARLAGAPVLARGFADPAGPAVAGAGLSQLPEQPDRTGAGRRPPAQGGRLGARARHAGGLRRVLPGAGLGGATDCRCCIRRSATATTPGCWRCTRCRRARRWPAIGPDSSPVTAGLVAELLAVRKHAGMMVPTPVQAAMVAALDDDAHERAAAAAVRAAAGRAAAGAAVGRTSPSTIPRPACICGPPAASHAGTRVAWLAERGILVAPGEFYGPRRRAARAGRADGHRRADRRRGAAARLADTDRLSPRQRRTCTMHRRCFARSTSG